MLGHFNLACRARFSVGLTMEHKEGAGVEVVLVEPVALLPHLLQLVLTALKTQTGVVLMLVCNGFDM